MPVIKRPPASGDQTIGRRAVGERIQTQRLRHLMP
jgi:hypothetical protein